jgi:uncharacterized protein (DUF1330 family)
MFHEFEALAIPLISHHNGKLLARIRPTEETIIDGIWNKPYEIHLVEFATELDLENFMNDKSRQAFLQLKEQSVESSVLIKGSLFKTS